MREREIHIRVANEESGVPGDRRDLGILCPRITHEDRDPPARGVRVSIGVDGDALVLSGPGRKDQRPGLRAGARCRVDDRRRAQGLAITSLERRPHERADGMRVLRHGDDLDEAWDRRLHVLHDDQFGEIP
jgi:hypothetical protein